MTMTVTLTIKGTSVTEEGLTFTPRNGASDFDRAIPEVIMWDDNDEVTVEVTDEAVLITTTVVDTTSQFVSTTTRTTTAYRCPVAVKSYRVDFSLGATTDDEYVPATDVPDYGMFSDAGNLAVEEAIINAMIDGEPTTAAEVAATVEGHPEVMDTVVREHIHTCLTEVGLVRNS